MLTVARTRRCENESVLQILYFTAQDQIKSHFTAFEVVQQTQKPEWFRGTVGVNMRTLRIPSCPPPQSSFSSTKVIEIQAIRSRDEIKISKLCVTCTCLKFMGGAVRLRELPGVTVLNQIEVKVNELLVVLFGNPLVDAVKSEETSVKRLSL